MPVSSSNEMYRRRYHQLPKWCDLSRVRSVNASFQCFLASKECKRGIAKRSRRQSYCWAKVLWRIRDLPLGFPTVSSCQLLVVAVSRCVTGVAWLLVHPGNRVWLSRRAGYPNPAARRIHRETWQGLQAAVPISPLMRPAPQRVSMIRLSWTGRTRSNASISSQFGCCRSRRCD